MTGVATRRVGTVQAHGFRTRQIDGHSGKRTEPEVGSCVSRVRMATGGREVLAQGFCASSVDSVPSEFVRLNSFKVNI